MRSDNNDPFSSETNDPSTPDYNPFLDPQPEPASAPAPEPPASSAPSTPVPDDEPVTAPPDKQSPDDFEDDPDTANSVPSQTDDQSVAQQNETHGDPENEQQEPPNSPDGNSGEPARIKLLTNTSEDSNEDLETLTQQTLAQDDLAPELRDMLNATEGDTTKRMYEQRARSWIEFSVVRNDTLKKIEAVVDSPPQLQPLVDEFAGDPQAQPSIYLVVGAPKTGRYATALKLALALNAQMGGDQDNPTNIREYIPDITTRSLSIEDIITRINQQIDLAHSQTGPAASDASLIDDSDEANIPTDAIIIVRDAFRDAPDKGNLRELRASYVRRFKQLLGSVTLILTTDITHEQNPDISNYPLLATQSERGDLHADLSALYDRHLDFYLSDDPELGFLQATRALLLTSKASVLEKFTRPYQIDKFFDHVSTREPADAAEVLALADNLLGGQTQLADIRRWFEGLEFFNQKLYVMFAVMFEGLRRYEIDELYDEAVFYLRADAAHHYEDPRYISVRTMLDDIHMEQNANETLEFIGNDAAYTRVVRDQMSDYYRLLWGLVDRFVQKIRQASANRDRRLRRLLATNIGQIGIYRQRQLQQILNSMTEDQPHVAEAATHTLIEIASHVDHHDFIVKILRDWLNSGLTTRKVSALGAIVGIYQRINQQFLAGSEANSNETRIATKTLNILRNLLDHYVSTITDVQRDRDYREFIKQLDAQRTALREQTLRAILADATMQRLWESSPVQQQQMSQVVASRVDEQIERLAASAQLNIIDQLSLAAVDRLIEITRNQSQPMMALLRDWLTAEPDDMRWQIARMVINALLRNNNPLNSSDLRAEQLQLFDLLPEILRASTDVRSNIAQLTVSHLLEDEIELLEGGPYRQRIEELVSISPIGQVLTATEAWYGYLVAADQQPPDDSSSQIWYEEVFARLLTTLNSANEPLRNLFIVELLATWFKSTHQAVVNSAMTLFRRAIALNGMILDLPTSRYGVLLLDAGTLRSDQYEAYLNTAHRTAQILAAFTPLRIAHMGRAAADSALRVGNLDSQRQLNTLRRSDLQTTVGHPALLLPALEALTADRADDFPDDCHYVLIMNLQPVADLADLIAAGEDLYASAENARRTYNPFFDDDAPPTRAEIEWRWHGKLIVNRGNAEPDTVIPPILPAQAVTTYSAVVETFSDEDQRSALSSTLLSQTQQRMTTRLQQLTLAEALADLNIFYSGPGAQAAIPAPDDLFNKLEEWLAQMATPTSLPPTPDPAILINWSLLVAARADLARTVDTVLAWLQDGAPDDPATIVGSAATKQLFRFYGTSDAATAAEQGVLLKLLPAYLQWQPQYSEIDWIIRLLLTLAKDKAWSERLTSAAAEGDMPELLAALQEIHDPDVRAALLELVEYHEVSQRLVNLFLQLSNAQKIDSLAAFISLLVDLLRAIENEQQHHTRQRRRSRRTRRTRYRAAPDAPRLDEVLKRIGDPQQARELLELPGLKQDNLKRILEDLQQTERRMARESNLHITFAEEMLNQRAVLDTMRLHLSSQTRTLPPLPAGHDYGIILLGLNTSYAQTQGHSYAATAATTFIIGLLQALVDHENGATIVPVVHRLGRNDVLYTHKAGARQRITLKAEQLLPAGGQDVVPLMGPLLERYPADDVGFVLLVSDIDIVDLADWATAEDSAWLARLYLYALRNIEAHGVQQIATQRDSSTDGSAMIELVNQIMNAVLKQRRRNE